MIVSYFALIVLFSLICCWMASSSSAPSKGPERSSKANRQIYVSLTSICTQGDRDGVMFCIRGFKVNKKNDFKKRPISTRYIYDSEEEAIADENLFKWYHGDKTNEPGEPAMPEPWDPDRLGWLQAGRLQPKWPMS